MRTTVVLPPDLLRQAKIRAAERGESLKSFMTRAADAELATFDRALVHRYPTARVAWIGRG